MAEFLLNNSVLPGFCETENFHYLLQLILSMLVSMSVCHTIEKLAYYVYVIVTNSVFYTVVS